LRVKTKSCQKEPRISNCTLTSYGHNNINSENTKLFIGKEKILRRSKLQMDLLNFSANPYSVNCEGVCQVHVIAVILNATNYCNESTIKDWECGLEELKRNFSDKLNSIYKRISLRTYSIRNPVDNEHLWLNCNGSDTKDSFSAIKSCVNVLHSLNFNSQPAPIVIIIKMTSKEGSYTAGINVLAVPCFST
jgi:hypothetical protein